MLSGCSSAPSEEVAVETPALSAAQLDATFGQNGLAPVFPAQFQRSRLLPDGRLLVAGIGAELAGSGQVPVVVVRYTESGQLDPTFAEGGVWKSLVSTPDTGSFDAAGNVSIAVGTDGRIHVVANVFTSERLVHFPRTVVAARLLSDGEVDPSALNVAGGPWRKVADVGSGNWSMDAAVAPDGRLLVLTHRSPYVLRLDDDLQQDAAFAAQIAQGTAYHHYAGALNAHSIVVAPSGDMVLGGALDQSPHSIIVRVKPDGSASGKAFAFPGQSVWNNPGKGYFELEAIAVTPSGRIVGAGTLRDSAIQPGSTRAETRNFVFAFDANDELDASFGTGGISVVNPTVDPHVSFPIAGSAVSRSASRGHGFHGVTVDGAGRILASGESNGAPIITRFLADGTPDESFGDEGTVSLDQLKLPAITTIEAEDQLPRSYVGAGVHVAPNGRIVLALARPEKLVAGTSQEARRPRIGAAALAP